MAVPRKPLQLSDRCGPVSLMVPALQLELHHPAPRSLLCMDASFCVLRCRVLRRAKSKLLLDKLPYGKSRVNAN